MWRTNRKRYLSKGKKAVWKNYHEREKLHFKNITLFSKNNEVIFCSLLKDYNCECSVLRKTLVEIRLLSYQVYTAYIWVEKCSLMFLNISLRRFHFSKESLLGRFNIYWVLKGSKTGGKSVYNVHMFITWVFSFYVITAIRFISPQWCQMTNNTKKTQNSYSVQLVCLWCAFITLRLPPPRAAFQRLDVMRWSHLFTPNPRGFDGLAWPVGGCWGQPNQLHFPWAE